MIVLQRATIEDMEVILDIHTKAFNDEMQRVLGRDGGPDGYNTVDENSRIINDFLTYKILFNSKTIGFFFLIPFSEDHVSLESFCIYPEYQNKGFGYKSLLEMERVNSHVKKWSLTSMKGSDRIQHLYEKFGYKKIAEEEWFYKYEKIIKGNNFP